MDGFKKKQIGACPHGLKVYLVDGTYVRNTFDSDYVQGGNPERYPWIPKGEIWVDDTTPKAEIPYVALHECNEANLMATKGEGYEQAHSEAKELENKERHANHPGEPMEPARCVVVTCYNGQGQLLMGKRNDNDRYTLVAGHIEQGESPNQAAARELHEETGLRPVSLSFLKDYTLSNGTELHCFSAYVTGEPHPKNDPDDEVGEWEWIDIEEGLPPKVYDHLHGPQDEQNLVKQLFTLQKAEWEELFKRAKVWHSDDWGTNRISIPSMEHPDRTSYDKNYLSAIKSHYGNVRPVQVTTDKLLPKNEVHDTSRYNLYRKMYRAGEKLPPMVVKKSSTSGLYEILDGNHKYHAVKAEGGGKMNAVEPVEEPVHEEKLIKTEAKCAKCSKPATVKVIWAEGMAYQPSCDDHKEDFKKKFGDEFCNFRPINKADELEKTVLDPNAGYTLKHKIANHVNYYETDPAKRNFQVVSVSAHAPNGEEVGRANFGDDDSGRFSIGHVHVLPEHRRKGIASAMYAHAEKITGKKLQPAQAQTQEGQALWAGNAVAPQFGKAEDDEVYRLLNNPDPIERRMALRLDSVRPEHLFAAALDPDPSVYQPAIDDPRFGPVQSQALMEAVVGKNGAYPDDQKRMFLMRHGRVEPYHFTALARAARMAGPARYATTVADIVAHPMCPAPMLRTLYLDPDVGHDARMAIVAHLHAPADLLDHALRTAVTVPGGGAAEVGSRAVEHLELPYGSLRALVERAADRSEPHMTALAAHALEYNQGLTTPALAEIFKDLLPKAQLKPTTAAPALLAALLRNKNMSPELADEATRVLPPGTLLHAGVMDNPAFGPQHLQKMLVKALDELLPTNKPPMEGVAQHPVVMCQLGFDPSFHRAFKAARFLSGITQVPPEVERQAFYVEDGDCDRAALAACGMPISDENMKALKGVMSLTKSDDPILEPTPKAEKIVTAHPEGEDVAEKIQRAFKHNYVFPVALGGKHSKGSIIAYDEKTHTTILLKSGSGGAGGAAGSKQDPSNPNAREAAFYYIAKEWGIGEYFPRAEEVIIDERPYAALQLLALDFTTLDAQEKKEPGTARRVLAPYLYDGTLHKWAVIDYVLGNPDRHGQNVMVDPKGTVRLIDHGSAFAGTGFDPAHDGGSFVPFYLRAWALDENFNKLPTETKLKDLPRVPATVAQELKVWVAGISPENLRLYCTRYGINPQPTLDRLQRVMVRVANEPVDLVIDQLWVTT